MATLQEADSNQKTDSINLEYLVDGDGQINLIPIPALDVADPLNWSSLRRWTVSIALSIWLASCLLTQSYMSYLLPHLAVEFPSVSSGDLNLLVTIITAVCAPSSLLFVALFDSYGRRLPFLISNTLLLVALIWGAWAKSYWSLFGSRILQAIGTSPSDAIIYMLIQDFTFTHERGFMMGAVLNSGYGLFYILCIALPHLTTTPSYAGHFYLLIGLIFVCTVAFFALIPETKYDRYIHPPAASNMTKTEHRELKQSLRNAPYPLRNQLQLLHTRSEGPEDSFHHIFCLLGNMAKDGRIWWCGLLNAVVTGGMVAYTTYFAEMLLMPPWSWPAGNIGLINLVGIPLAIWNWAVLGWGSDKLVLYLSKKSGGRIYPEYRLPILVIPACFAIAAYIGFDFLAQHYINGGEGESQPHWFSLVIIHCFVLMGFTGILEVTYSYLISTSSPGNALAAMTLTSIIRGDVSFGMSYGVSAFVANCGYATAFGVYGFLVGIFCIMGVVVYNYSLIRARQNREG